MEVGVVENVAVETGGVDSVETIEDAVCVGGRVVGSVIVELSI